MLLDRYWKEINNLYDKVKTTQRENIIEAGKLIAESVDRGHAFIFMIPHIMIGADYRGGGLILYKRFKYNLDRKSCAQT